ncbi:hypothetical protein BpHYR1_017926 [Brachionus plicatilis]|uniref:Uncharacterized protein n=1 Tax=Brachionus plicatilis TaxID=10195 RepID=A0A3M7SXB0_BRAPC|nr:hypothetical protein BpHYR1_017926 [Brachionus plicatilis]
MGFHLQEKYILIKVEINKLVSIFNLRYKVTFTLTVTAYGVLTVTAYGVLTKQFYFIYFIIAEWLGVDYQGGLFTITTARNREAVRTNQNRQVEIMRKRKLVSDTRRTVGRPAVTWIHRIIPFDFHSSRSFAFTVSSLHAVPISMSSFVIVSPPCYCWSSYLTSPLRCPLKGSFRYPYFFHFKYMPHPSQSFFSILQYLRTVYPENLLQAYSVEGVQTFSARFTHPPAFTSEHPCFFYYIAVQFDFCFLGKLVDFHAARRLAKALFASAS